MADLATIKVLAQRWLDGTITEDEKAIFEQWYHVHPEQVIAWTGENSKDELRDTMLTAILKGIEHEEEVSKTVPFNYRKIFVRIAVAASVLVFIGGYLLFNKKIDPAVVKTEKPTIADISPAKDGAILTLGNGTKITLDSTDNGHIAKQGDAIVQKQNGRIRYDVGQLPAGKEVLYNTMTTPKGMKYEVVLADGSHVWMNAASSITYPTTFTGRERKVTITGEIYFEVAHDENRPFVVVNGKTSVQVLGTHFNINAYDDENVIKVTLLQGSVNVVSENGRQQSSLIIKPSEQAVVKSDGQLSLNKNADVDEAMAWKNGFFSFKNADIKTVMRQISRWYDIDVVYEGNNYKETFSGKIGRGLTLRDLLDGLAQTSVHYKIEQGRKLYILP